jgi:hypothetical protein
MITSKLLRALFPIIPIIATGCSSIEKMNAPLLLGSPVDSALVIVKVDALMHGSFGITSSQEIKGGILLRTDGSKRIDAKAVSGLIIFSNVPPGEYNLAGVEAQWQAGTTSYVHKYAVPPESVGKFVFSVKIGEPRFVGLITINEYRQGGRRNFEFLLHPSKEIERTTWEKFTELYPKSDWNNFVLKKINDL